MSPSAPRTRQHSHTRWAFVFVAGLLAACAAPELTAPEDPQEPSIEDDITAETPEPTEQALQAVLDDLAELIANTDQALTSASEATSATERQDALEDALALLLDNEATSTAAMFPAVNPERDVAGDGDDLLTRLLTAARESASTLGRATVETLRDPIAGDLGSWELDPEGMVADIEATASGLADVDEASDAIMQLDGEGTRAMAWTVLASTTDDDTLADEAAERARAHLSVVDVAVTMLSEDE